jgi:serine/threonine protein kinase
MPRKKKTDEGPTPSFRRPCGYQIKEKLGEGAYGQVFRVAKKDHGEKQYA